MSTKDTKEKRIRAKILKALRKKKDGYTAKLRQFEINQLVGQSSVRAPYLKELLDKMQDEKVIDRHYWQTDTTRRRSCWYWALFNHPDNIKYRKRRKKAEKESIDDSEVVGMSISEYAELVYARSAARRAKEKFQSDLDSFIADNHEEIFAVMRRICRKYSPKTRWLHSRQWL